MIGKARIYLHLIIRKRIYQFLSRLKAHYNLILWTNSKKKLTGKVIQKLNLKQYFTALLYQEDMVDKSKDIKQFLEVDMAHVIYLDTDYEVVKKQDKNYILLNQFNGVEKRKNFLDELANDLIKIDMYDDVRPCRARLAGVRESKIQPQKVYSGMNIAQEDTERKNIPHSFNTNSTKMNTDRKYFMTSEKMKRELEDYIDIVGSTNGYREHKQNNIPPDGGKVGFTSPFKTDRPKQRGQIDKNNFKISINELDTIEKKDSIRNSHPRIDHLQNMLKEQRSELKKRSIVSHNNKHYEVCEQKQTQFFNSIHKNLRNKLEADGKNIKDMFNIEREMDCVSIGSNNFSSLLNETISDENILNDIRNQEIASVTVSSPTIKHTNSRFSSRGFGSIIQPRQLDE